MIELARGIWYNSISQMKGAGVPPYSLQDSLCIRGGALRPAQRQKWVRHMQMSEFNQVMAVVWILGIIIFSLIEALTPQLISIWFAASCVVGVVAATLNAPLWVQLACFVGLSLVLVIATRPLARKLNRKTERTNAEALIGKTAKVLTEIDNVEAVGTVRVDGQIWSARSKEGEIIPAETEVMVRSIEGVKLIVEPKEGVTV